MRASNAFIQKPLHVQISEILEEDVPSTQEAIVHYYVDVEGEEEFPPSSQEEIPARRQSKAINEFLRLSQQVVRHPRVKIHPLIDYSQFVILTSEQHCETIELKAEKRAKALGKIQSKKEAAIGAKAKIPPEKTQLAISRARRLKEKANKRRFNQVKNYAPISLPRQSNLKLERRLEMKR